jgi:hypothetical protein
VSDAPQPRSLATNRLIRLSAQRRRPLEFVIEPEAAEAAALAADLGLRAVGGLRLTGRLAPEGLADWGLRARIEAVAVQDCVVTLEPVETRIAEDVERRYLADLPPPPPGETEMPEDDRVEPMPAQIDLGELLREALALALPPWPRADGAGLGEFAAEPGQATPPQEEERARPFAGLAEALRRRD